MLQWKTYDHSSVVECPVQLEGNWTHVCQYLLIILEIMQQFIISGTQRQLNTCGNEGPKDPQTWVREENNYYPKAAIASPGLGKNA
jgi:hypothetical protein